MTVALQTRYVGPTNFRPARIVAETLGLKPAHRLTFSYNYSGNQNEHFNAAKALITKLNWGGQWHAGDTATGYVYVKTPAGEFSFEVEKRSGE